MSQQKRDYYEVLGIDKTADPATIKKAYRKLAKKYHPDSNVGNEAAAEKFKEVNEAYDILSDPEKKKLYDQFGHAAFDGTGAAGAGSYGANGGFGSDGSFTGGFGGFSGNGGFRGIIFILLSLTNVREKIFNAIPMTLKHSVSAGIGLFIAFIGLQNAKIVVDGATLVGLYSFKASVQNGTFSTEGITVLLALIGILITAVLLVKQVKGGILWGILATWILGIICQLAGIYQVNPEAGAYSLLPDFSNGIAIPSMAPTLMKMDFSSMFSLDFFAVVFAFLFVDLFDTLGTLIGVASKADMLDKDGKLPRIRGALLSDAVGTTVGAMFGTSTVTTFVESASGVAEGGRTGLTAAVAAILFGLSLFLSPIFLAIPSFATAPALIVVGFLMISSILKIDFNDYTESIPAYIGIIAMPFMYSISEGISMGIISYVVINLVCGKAKEKKISPLLYILAVLFILKYIML